MYIRAKDGIINLITIENIEDAICEVEVLPTDIYATLHLNKYLAYEDGIRLNPNWEDPSKSYQYFIIPTDFVGDVTGFGEFVREARPDLNFNIICQSIDIQLSSEKVTVPTNVVNMSVGAVRVFDETGIGMINGIIDAWNEHNPTKIINEPYRFNNFDDFMQFKNLHK